MVSFRRKKKQMHMEEKQAAAAAREQETDEIKVTDRRRINVDMLDAEDFAPTPEEEIGDLQPIADLEQKLREAEERNAALERTVADVQSRFEQARHKMQVEIDEIRTRLNRTAEERAQRGKGDVVTVLLPVADTLQLAIAAAEKGGTLETLLDGVRGTERNFLNALLSVGVEPIIAVGQPFNPELHEAIDMIPVGADQDGIVTAEYQRGYKMGERLLRPARVQVGRAG
jgi:molecular chaperone GrpE